MTFLAAQRQLPMCGTKAKYRETIIFLLCFRIPSDTDQISHFFFGKPFVKPGFKVKFGRQCGTVGRALALRSGDPGFKTHSDHSLNLFLVVPGSTSRPHLKIANWFASGQLGFLNSCCCCSVSLFVFTDPEKHLWGAVN